MSEIELFEYNGRPMRWVQQDDKIGVLAADLAEILDYSHASNMVQSLDDDERGHAQTMTPSGSQNMLVVWEPGIYTLVIKSTKPEAVAFRRWVTHEVLPQIRRTGAYVVPTSSLGALRQLAQQNLQIIDELLWVQETAERAEVKALETSARLDAIEGRHEWYAALGIAKLRGWVTDSSYLNRLGRIAGKIGKESGLRPGRVDHALFGRVNSWPAWVWDAAYEEFD